MHRRAHNLARVYRKVSIAPIANTNSAFSEFLGVNRSIICKNCKSCYQLLQIDSFYAKSKSKRKNVAPTHPDDDFESVCIECWDSRSNHNKRQSSKEKQDYACFSFDD